MLAQVGMLDYADARSAQLSADQRRRAALALSLANDPSLLLADEPVSQYAASTLAGPDQVQLNAVAARLKPIRIGPGQIVVRQGERADRFYIIADGEAQVLLGRPDGGPVQVATLRAGEYFAEIALLGGGRRTATVRASETGLDVVALGRDVFSDLLVGHLPRPSPFAHSWSGRTAMAIAVPSDPLVQHGRSQSRDQAASTVPW